MFNILALLLGLLASPAAAQTCPTRPAGDSSNACASTAFVRNAQSAISILDFGGKNDGTGDNGPACIAALSSMNLTVGGKLIFPAGTYNFNTSCTVPAFKEPAVVAFEMYGAKLTTSNAITIINRLPTDQTNADLLVGAEFHFMGGVFIGTQLANQKGIFLGASYNSTIVNTEFDDLDYGVQFAFSLNGYAQSVRGFLNLTCTICIESGLNNWTSGSQYNSASNMFHINSFRDYESSGQVSSIRILGSDQVNVSNSIFEGYSPQYNIYYDDQGSPTVKYLTLYNVHQEVAASKAVVGMTGSGGGHYTFDKVFISSTPTFLDVTIPSSGYASGLGTSSFNIVDFVNPGGISGTAFKINTANQFGGAFYFRNFGQGTIDISTAGYWSLVPFGLLHMTREASGNGYLINCQYCYMGSVAITGADTKGIFPQGNILFATDNTFYIGKTASYRPKGINVGSDGLITSGPLSGTTGTFSSAVSGTTGTFSSTVSGVAGTFSGTVTGANLTTAGNATALRYNSTISVPAASSCGTSPVVDAGSSAHAGKITFGSATTVCTLTFASAFDNNAYCTVTPLAQPAAVANIPYISAQSKTTFTISGGTASSAYQYTCGGN